MGWEVESRSPSASTRRIFAMVVAIGCHLGLLVLLLRPAVRRTDMTPVVDSDAAVLHVRLISSPRPSSMPPPLPAPRPAPISAAARQAPARETMSPPALRFRTIEARPPAVDSTHASRPPVAPETPATRDHYTNNQAPTENRDFRERLFDARHSHDVHGVPGSDARVAPGIQLVDPTNQGVGAVMRRAQRLFGVTSRHCVDVEVWRHLTPRELDAQHLSAIDVKRQAAKYGCDRPLGLSF